MVCEIPPLLHERAAIARDVWQNFEPGMDILSLVGVKEPFRPAEIACTDEVPSLQGWENRPFLAAVTEAGR